MEVSTDYLMGLRDATAWIDATNPTMEDLNLTIVFAVGLIRESRNKGFPAIAEYFSGYLTKTQSTREALEAIAATTAEKERQDK